eukprot:gnl/Dysnectes_brevis/3175_a3965_801.p1 GENE.gnl/Dysnectes_brevis/3175_a3965_801~~gnl/Dysnectes_brevis/3175_a3965_801.p1  ORF type:complete len:602 (+),score=105.92 gnl/Dysnectes_brevis/3175_a3965_801:117-1922(+)
MEEQCDTIMQVETTSSPSEEIEDNYLLSTLIVSMYSLLIHFTDNIKLPPLSYEDFQNCILCNRNDPNDDLLFKLISKLILHRLSHRLHISQVAHKLVSLYLSPISRLTGSTELQEQLRLNNNDIFKLCSKDRAEVFHSLLCVLASDLRVESPMLSYGSSGSDVDCSDYWWVEEAAALIWVGRGEGPPKEAPGTFDPLEEIEGDISTVGEESSSSESDSQKEKDEEDVDEGEEEDTDTPLRRFASFLRMSYSDAATLGPSSFARPSRTPCSLNHALARRDTTESVRVIRPTPSELCAIAWGIEVRASRAGRAELGHWAKQVRTKRVKGFKLKRSFSRFKSRLLPRLDDALSLAALLRGGAARRRTTMDTEEALQRNAAVLKGRAHLPRWQWDHTLLPDDPGLDGLKPPPPQESLALRPKRTSARVSTAAGPYVDIPDDLLEERMEVYMSTERAPRRPVARPEALTDGRVQAERGTRTSGLSVGRLDYVVLDDDDPVFGSDHEEEEYKPAPTAPRRSSRARRPPARQTSMVQLDRSLLHALGVPELSDESDDESSGYQPQEVNYQSTSGMSRSDRYALRKQRKEEPPIPSRRSTRKRRKSKRW